jgi:hypothetical protein
MLKPNCTSVSTFSYEHSLKLTAIDDQEFAARKIHRARDPI